MAFQPVPNVAKATVVAQRGGVEMVNTFYWEFVGGYTQGALDDLADAVDAVVGSEWLPILPQVVVYVGTEVIGLSEQNDLFSFNNDSAGAGAQSGETAPSQVSLAIKRTSNNTGRSARGRIYWFGFIQTQLSGTGNNFVDAAPLANAIAAVDEMRQIDIMGDESPVIVSRFTGGAAREVGVTFPWVATSVSDNRVDTQRGRLPSPASG